MQWVDVIKKCHDIQLNFSVVDVIYSGDQATRVVILQRADGTFDVFREQLFAYDEHEVEHFKLDTPGFWREDPALKTIADTIEHSRKIVVEDHWLT